MKIFLKMYKKVKEIFSFFYEIFKKLLKILGKFGVNEGKTVNIIYQNCMKILKAFYETFGKNISNSFEFYGKLMKIEIKLWKFTS